MEKTIINLFIDPVLNEKMRKTKIRKKGDISKYINDLIREDLKK